MAVMRLRRTSLRQEIGMQDTFPNEWQLREEITALEEEGYDVTAARQRLEAVAGREGALE
jgi:hypothetical protein